MSQAKVLALLCLTLAGCSAADKQIVTGLRDRLRGRSQAEAVASQAPSDSQPAVSAGQAGADPDGIRPVEFVEPADPSSPASATAREPIGELAESIVARVNGEVILAQDLLAPLRGRLAQAQQQQSPAEFVKFRNSELQRQLRDLIERQLLIQEAKRQLPEPAIKRLEAMADKEFGSQIESEMKRMGVNTEAELRRKMLAEGDSLDQLREFRRGTLIAQQYLRSQLGPRLDVSREEMLEYYKRHRDQFAKEGGVRWSEILVTTERHGSPDAARARAEQLSQQLRGGAEFAELAKTESDGATASEGGRWGLTTKGSYAVAAVDDALFTLPVGQMSDTIEGPKGWHLIRVDERVPGGVQSFTDVQEDIRQAIREEKIQKESQRYLQELVRKAHITTIFDQPNLPAQPASNRK